MFGLITWIPFRSLDFASVFKFDVHNMFQFQSCITPSKTISLNGLNAQAHVDMLAARIRQALQSLPSSPQPLIGARWELGLATEVVRDAPYLFRRRLPNPTIRWRP